MLIELLISIVVLTIGLGGLMVLLVSAMYTNTRAGKDTTSTMVAEHVLEQISAQPADATIPPIPLQITDCTNAIWVIDPGGATLGAGTGANGGNGADLTAGGVVDWTQSYASVPGNYKMQYTACGAGGRQTVYDVRWNVITMTNYTRLVVVSARPTGSAAVGGLRFVIPANLRTIAGM
jgi:type II secretory pathway pseudopilin PulG